MVSNIISRIFQILFFQLFPFFTYSFLLFFSVPLVHLVHTFYVNTITFAQPQYSFFFSDLSLNIFLKYCFIRRALLLTVSEKFHIRKSCISSKIELIQNKTKAMFHMKIVYLCISLVAVVMSPSVCQYRKKTETQIKTLLRCNLEVDLTDLSRLFPFSCCVDGLFCSMAE